MAKLNLLHFIFLASIQILTIRYTETQPKRSGLRMKSWRGTHQTTNQMSTYYYKERAWYVLANTKRCEFIVKTLIRCKHTMTSILASAAPLGYRHSNNVTHNILWHIKINALFLK